MRDSQFASNFAQKSQLRRYCPAKVSIEIECSGESRSQQNATAEAAVQHGLQCCESREETNFSCNRSSEVQIVEGTESGNISIQLP
jgi:hypothetical protein